MQAGRQDVERAVAELAARLPEPLGVLARLAYNYRWSWLPDGHDVFRMIDPIRWRRIKYNPVRILQEASAAQLERAAGDAALLERAAAMEEAVRADLAREPRPGAATVERPVAFFCAEYAVHVSLPIYSGGLGALAGDILKEASDRALPLVAVGLMYQQGYFRQRIDAAGWQHEYWIDSDAPRLPAALVTGDDGRPITIEIPIRGTDVIARIWRVEVGRVPLFLLDADLRENDRMHRWITSRLYVSDPDVRLAQYALLGIGGVRALAALGVDPAILHLNEGHAALAPVELAHALAARGASRQEALEGARRRTRFTTHTPVPAGNDTYPSGQVADTLDGFASDLGLDSDALVKLGRTSPENAAEPFGVTQLALRMSRGANGVSRRHGEVAREMWNGLWPERKLDDVPIGHVTNGVHVPTWIGTPMRQVLDRHLGEGWIYRAHEPETWAALDQVGDEELWAARREQRAQLVDYVRDRSVTDRLSRSEPRDYVEIAARAFQPEVLTIGFARRLATYKRMHLLFQDPRRSLNLLAGGRPIQFVLAGKAHPRDDPGKQLVHSLFALKGAPEIDGRVVFLDDYDLAMGARLVQGCDVWVNLPRPPLEASGTSGMKNAVNGGLQLSVLDGWWAEAYDGTNGWALSGEVHDDHVAQDARDSQELYRLLEEEVVASYHDRDAAGLPRAWLAMVRASLRSIAPAFAAGRMLADYERSMYSAR